MAGNSFIGGPNHQINNISRMFSCEITINIQKDPLINIGSPPFIPHTLINSNKPPYRHILMGLPPHGDSSCWEGFEEWRKEVQKRNRFLRVKGETASVFPFENGDEETGLTEREGRDGEGA